MQQIENLSNLRGTQDLRRILWPLRALTFLSEMLYIQYTSSLQYIPYAGNSSGIINIVAVEKVFLEFVYKWAF